MDENEIDAVFLAVEVQEFLKIECIERIFGKK